MRLTAPVIVDDGRPASITLRFVARNIPDGATVDVTDLQFQGGRPATGVVPNVMDAGTAPDGLQRRNGVLREDQEIVLLSNADAAAPSGFEVVNASGAVRIGSFDFGQVDGEAFVDGRGHIASQGHGRAPIITERSNLNLKTSVEGTAHLRAEWEDRTR